MLSPRHFLDAATEWRKNVWRRWLISYLVQPGQVPVGVAEAATTPANAAEPSWKSVTESGFAPAGQRIEGDIGRGSAPHMPPPTPPTPPIITADAHPTRPPSYAEPPGPDSEAIARHIAGERFANPSPKTHPEREPDRFVEQRRADVRARFDALSDRLLSVEDMLDSISRRLISRENMERRSEQRLLEMVESVAESCERQTQAIENSVSLIMRLEQRILRALREEANDGRRSVMAPAPQRASASTAPTAQEPFFWEERRKSRPVADGGDDFETQPSNFSIRGSLGEMSLPTVFSMLELERHTGRLVVRSEDGQLASFDLADGAVITSRFNENDADPVVTLREALRWTNGTFGLVQSAPNLTSPPPRTIGSLLLEATRQNDEANADRLM